MSDPAETTTAAPRLTPAQTTTLRAAADGHLWQTSVGTIFQATNRRTGKTVNHKTIDRLRGLGYIRAGQGDGVHRRWEITDTGRSALDQH
ncbi:hypothetical protein [Micromonospora sp. NBC_00421]|uniref:hypothetical protein n=1 Tax=Micromonospora sp. NBC_00421 TaxID=2975976 RepID=UPI002E1BAF27